MVWQLDVAAAKCLKPNSAASLQLLTKLLLDNETISIKQDHAFARTFKESKKSDGL